MSKIIKQVPVNDLPVVINSLQLAVSAEENQASERPLGLNPEILRASILRAERQAAAAIAKAKQEMEAELETRSAEIYKESHDTGFSTGYAEGKAQGYSDGYAEGYSVGEQAAQAKMEKAINDATAEAAKILSTANEQVKETVLSAEPQIIEIALAIAEKILASEIDANSDAVVSIVKAAMDKVRNQEQIAIRVNPMDFANVIAAKKEFEYILQREQSIEFVSDQTVSRGGCVIDSAFGSADARIETQLQAIQSVIRSLHP